jgi:hypothetical protein
MRTAATLLIVVLIAGPLASKPPDAESKKERPNPDPATQAYAERQVEGWTVRVNERLLADKELSARVLRLLQEDLYRITRVLPADAVTRLRKVPIWVELDHPQHPCACYHTSADWLREHNMDVKKVKCVEIANARNYLTWSHAQPSMVLHELAHAYHDQVLGFDHAEVRACYDAAVSAKNYESVLHHTGARKRHYALTNDREYFAEATEAYFGTNDFYPFIRPELKEHDPRAFGLIPKLWGCKERGAIDGKVKHE